MTPLQALLAHASPGAPFGEFAAYITNGSWPLEGDDDGEGLLSTALDAAKYEGTDSNIVPFVSAMIAAGARLPPSAPEGSNIHLFQPWRKRLPVCSLLINLARSNTPVDHACRVIDFIDSISTGEKDTIKKMVQSVEDKARALSPAKPSKVWSSPIQGLATLPFMVAISMTGPPLGIHSSAGLHTHQRRAGALTQLIASHPDAASTPLEILLCQVLVTANKKTSPERSRMLAGMAWNQLSPSSSPERSQWIADIRDQLAGLPEFSRATVCCALVDGVSRYAREDEVARELFVGLLPVLAQLKKQDTEAMVEESHSLSTAVGLRVLGEQIDPAQQIDLGMRVWICMSKASIPATDRRAFAARMLTALATSQPDPLVLQQALSDVEFVDDLEPQVLATLQAIHSSMGLQSTNSPRPTSRPGTRF